MNHKGLADKAKRDLQLAHELEASFPDAYNHSDGRWYSGSLTRAECDSVELIPNAIGQSMARALFGKQLPSGAVVWCGNPYVRDDGWSLLLTPNGWRDPSDFRVKSEALRIAALAAKVAP